MDPMQMSLSFEGFVETYGISFSDTVFLSGRRYSEGRTEQAVGQMTYQKLCTYHLSKERSTYF
jgi:hypothetical protein